MSTENYDHRDAEKLPKPPRSILSGYGRFLIDPREKFFLKVAPILMAAGDIEAVASNIIPVVGEIEDVGALALTAFVAVKTYQAIKRHR